MLEDVLAIADIIMVPFYINLRTVLNILHTIE